MSLCDGSSLVVVIAANLARFSEQLHSFSLLCHDKILCDGLALSVNLRNSAVFARSC